jgi:hypothetical protein
MKHVLLPLVAVACWVQAAVAQDAASALSKRSGTLAAGTVWETGYHVVDTGVKGPTVFIVGGMHGNEPAGARAAEQIRHWPIVKGKMVVVPRSNVLALEAKSRNTPDCEENECNLNRNFPQDQAHGRYTVTPLGELAAAIWELVAEVEPDWVIDLHEGYEFRRSHKPPAGKKKSVGSSVIYRGGDKMDPIVNKMIAAADTTVTDPGKKFSHIRGGPVSTGLARACINGLGAEGLIIETTFKQQPMSLRIRQHRLMVNVLLNHIGLIDRDCSAIVAAPARPGTLTGRNADTETPAQ